MYNIQQILKENPMALPPILRAQVGDAFEVKPDHPDSKEWAHTVINPDGSSSVGKFVRVGKPPQAYWQRVQ